VNSFTFAPSSVSLSSLNGLSTSRSSTFVTGVVSEIELPPMSEGDIDDFVSC
jgi:hypothetical protein